ncbi:hypothetical protein LCGC14_1581490, partial [marine sediment metagenome]
RCLCISQASCLSKSPCALHVAGVLIPSRLHHWHLRCLCFFLTVSTLPPFCRTAISKGIVGYCSKDIATLDGLIAMRASIKELNLYQIIPCWTEVTPAIALVVRTNGFPAYHCLGYLFSAIHSPSFTCCHALFLQIPDTTTRLILNISPTLT